MPLDRPQEEPEWWQGLEGHLASPGPPGTGIWLYWRKGNLTPPGPTQTHDHSGNPYFQTRVWVSRLDQKVFCIFMISHLVGELLWEKLSLFF